MSKRVRHGSSFSLVMLLLCMGVLLSGGAGNAMGKALYDDFSGSYLDPDKWYSYYINPQEVVSRVENGKLQSFTRGATDTDGFVLNGVFFQNPENITSIATQITIQEIQRITPIADMPGSPGAQLDTRWYDSANGTIQVWLTFQYQWGSDTLKADYHISDGVFQEGGDLATDLSINTAYEAKIEYNERRDQFVISAAGFSKTVDAPKKIGPPSQSEKFLLTGIWSDGPGDIGSITATFDDVYVNGELYDNFDTAPLDGTKWMTSEIARKVESGKLRLDVHNAGQESRRSNTIALTENDAPSVSADFTIKSGSVLTIGANSQCRIMGELYNDSRGPGSGQDYNGYEGILYAQLGITLKDDRTLYAWYYAERSDDAEWSTWTELVFGNFTAAIQFDTPTTLGLTFDETNRKIIFSCNDEQVAYDIITPIYATEAPYRSLRSRVYADPGESGYILVDVDNVYTDQGSIKQIGAEPGYVQASVSADETVELLVNSTNVYGDEPAYEWLLYTAIVGGTEIPVYLLSGSGAYPLDEVVESLWDYTFPFDEDGVTSLGQLSMAGLGLSSGDAFLYAYAYTNQGGSVHIDNIVAISVQ